MSTYLSNRDGGKTNEEGHYRFHVKAWTGNVLSGLQAQAKSPLALGVDITTGDVKVDYSGYGYTAWTDAVESVTLTTADPSNPRIDRIVGYIDRGVTPSSAVTNNPSILKFKAVAGTPAGSPSAPNDAAVQTSVGASNPWFSIANVLVGTGVTTISSGNITDTRVLVTVPANGVNNNSILNNSIAMGKNDFSTYGTTDANGWRDFGSFFAKSVTYTNTTNVAAHATLAINLAATFGSGPINGPTITNDNLVLTDRMTADSSFSGAISMQPTSTFSVLWRNARDGSSQPGTRRITATVYKV